MNALQLNIGKKSREDSDMPMDIQVGDILTMKKNHPCGSHTFSVLRIGMDFRLRCAGCGHEMMIPRHKAEKNIRKILRDE